MKKLIALLTVTVMMLTMVCCAFAAEQTDAEYVKEKGTLVVGYTDFTPMFYKNEDGFLIGFDFEMAAAFADWLGVDWEFAEISRDNWDNKVQELYNPYYSVDCVWGGITLTDEDKAAMSCSNAYCNNAQVVIVPVDVADKYQTAEDCAELVFAVEAGSAGEAEVTKLGYKCIPVQSQASALMEVADGTCDAAVIDSLMAAAMVGEGTSYENLTYTAPLNSEEYVVGFRAGSDLSELLNEFFKAAYEDGSMQRCAEAYGIQAALIEQK